MTFAYVRSVSYSLAFVIYPSMIDDVLLIPMTFVSPRYEVRRRELHRLSLLVTYS